MQAPKKISPLFAGLSSEEKLLLLASAAEAPAGKSELQERLSWGSTKLNACLSSLKNRGVITAEARPKDGSGRRPLAFSPAPELGLFLGIQCDQALDHLVLMDSAGKRRASRSFPARDWQETAAEAFLDNVETFLASAPALRDQVVAAGMTSGISFNKKGQAQPRGPSYAGEAVAPLAEGLGKRFGLPVAVGRPQVLFCRQGDLRGLIAQKRSFINITATDSLGIAIFINGESWLGQSGLSGDLGHLKLAGNELPCYCGAVGCLRTKLSYAGISQETRRRLAEAGGGARLSPEDFEGPDFGLCAARLVAAANEHDPLATGVVYDAATDLGNALATVVSLLNPELMFVHSVLADAKEIFGERIRAIIRKNCLELYSKALTLEFRGYSAEANADGAALYARDEYLKAVLAEERPLR